MSHNHLMISVLHILHQYQQCNRLATVLTNTYTCLNTLLCIIPQISNPFYMHRTTDTHVPHSYRHHDVPHADEAKSHFIRPGFFSLTMNLYALFRLLLKLTPFFFFLPPQKSLGNFLATIYSWWPSLKQTLSLLFSSLAWPAWGQTFLQVVLRRLFTHPFSTCILSHKWLLLTTQHWDGGRVHWPLLPDELPHISPNTSIPTSELVVLGQAGAHAGWC